MVLDSAGPVTHGSSFTAVEQLQEHIDAFITAYNETAEPFVWTKNKVHQRRFKNRRITQLSFQVLAPNEVPPFQLGSSSSSQLFPLKRISRISLIGW
jgi:hypothetical protein